MFDEIYNLHLINAELEWVQEITTLPDFRCIMFDKFMVREISNLLTHSKKKIMFVYDTTFNLCKFFVSPLLCKYLMFVEEPTVPLSFFMHEKKTEDSHNQFFRKVSQTVPELNDKRKAYFTTDHEDAFRNAIKSFFPSLTVLRCWNHLFGNIRDWIKKHNGKKLDSKVYCDNCRELFRCETKSAYLTMLKTMQEYWDSSFNQYFLKHIHCEIDLIARLLYK
jgi:hypothetical protein